MLHVRGTLVKVYFDGACWPYNPRGHMGYGAWVTGPDIDMTLHDGEPASFKNSSNVAEYKALLMALEYLLTTDHPNSSMVHVRGDSKLVIMQMSGEWKIKSGRYEPFARKALDLSKKFKNIRFTWIPREQNEVADILSNKWFYASGVKNRWQD